MYLWNNNNANCTTIFDLSQLWQPANLLNINQYTKQTIRSLSKKVPVTVIYIADQNEHKVLGHIIKKYPQKDLFTPGRFSLSCQQTRLISSYCQSMRSVTVTTPCTIRFFTFSQKSVFSLEQRYSGCIEWDFYAN